MAITSRRLATAHELRNLQELFTVVFESEPGRTVSDEYLEKLLQKAEFLALGAFDGDRLVGGVTAYELDLISGVKEFYLYNIAVHGEYQKQGIGKHLMEALREEARARGVDTIFVEAESDDGGAVAFYRSLKAEELSVAHFNIRP